MGRAGLTALSLSALLAVAPATVGAAPLLERVPPWVESPVADAAMRADVEAVRALLRDGADVNAAQGDGMTALHWAARLGDAEMAGMLIYAGAELEAGTRVGLYTPLHLAAMSGSGEVARALLEAGASPAAVTDPAGTRPLHLAAAAGAVDVIGALLEAGADANARESAWDQTPLIFAASRNRVDAIRALIAGGADPNLMSRTEDLIHMGRLDRAAGQKRAEVLRELTGGDATPTAAQIKAAVDAERRIYEAGVVPGSDDDEEEDDDDRRGGTPSITAMGGLTPLLHAARQGYGDAVAALLDGGADIDLASGSDGTTPLLMATINGQFDLALMLLERGADPNLASTLNGMTPLWGAVNAQWQPRTRYPQPQEQSLQTTTYLDVMEALLEAGADPDARLTLHPWYMVYSGCGNRNCGLIDTNGATAFLRAAYAVDVEAMKLLVAYGGDPNIPTKAPPRRERRSPDEFLREQAKQRLLSDTAFATMDDVERVELMASVRAELPDSMQVVFSDDVLAASPMEIRDEFMRAVAVSDSIKENELDPSGLPQVPVGGPAVYAIHAATGVGYGEGFAGNAHRHVPDGWMPALRYLVEELGVDVNARDHNGYNAVHHAAARGDNEMILYLVEHGADIMAVSRRGQTTVDMANGPVQRVSPFPETVTLLEGLGAKNNHRCMSCQ